MPSTSQAAGSSKSAKKSPPRKAAKAKAQDDALTLLMNDHREVEGWFAAFDKARSDDRKRELAAQICTALRVHTQIEEEIFYPAYLDATGDEDMNDEAIVEHDGARKLIDEIENGGPGADKWEAKVHVLSEMIKHHVHEEEKRDGMFARARKADLDLKALGEDLAERKRALMDKRSA
ncbi:MAG: hemerythrin domain-containing protein [Alphaproteobacteria bacterium]|nr:hemerythrin domain-containing protein [Alphaproteobacteria bacterium]